MLPCNGSWKLDLSTSTDEINDLNIALERIKELEHQTAQIAAKLDAPNKTNVRLLSDLYGHEMKSFSYIFLAYLCWHAHGIGQTIHTPDLFPKFEGFEDLFTFNTQLLSSLTICRHGLHLKFMALIMDTSEISVQRIFNGWVIS